MMPVFEERTGAVLPTGEVAWYHCPRRCDLQCQHFPANMLLGTNLHDFSLYCSLFESKDLPIKKN